VYPYRRTMMSVDAGPADRAAEHRQEHDRRGTARELDARVLSADPIDAELAAAGVPNPDGRTGYEAMKSLAASELKAGRSSSTP